MTLQALKYFVTVARLGSYSRAARECYVSQPALSRAINSLEKELGFRLFDRNTRAVTLTPQGEACLREAKEILQRCEKLKNFAAQEPEYRLRVGYMFNGYLYELGRKLASAPERIHLATCYDTFPHLRKQLLAGELDAILIPEINRRDIEEIEYVHLVRSRLYVMFPQNHFLAGRERIVLEDLRGLKFIGWDEEELPGVNEAYRAVCRSRGFEPDYVAWARKSGDAVVLAGHHGAAIFMAKTIAATAPEGFMAGPVTDSEERYGIICAWRKSNDNPVIGALRRLEEGFIT